MGFIVGLCGVRVWSNIGLVCHCGRSRPALEHAQVEAKALIFMAFLPQRIFWLELRQFAPALGRRGRNFLMHWPEHPVALSDQKPATPPRFNGSSAVANCHIQPDCFGLAWGIDRFLVNLPVSAIRHLTAAIFQNPLSCVGNVIPTRQRAVSAWRDGFKCAIGLLKTPLPAAAPF